MHRAFILLLPFFIIVCDHVHVDSNVVHRPARNTWFYTKVHFRSSTMDSDELDANNQAALLSPSTPVSSSTTQAPIVEKNMLIKNEVFKGDPRQFLG